VNSEAKTTTRTNPPLTQVHKFVKKIIRARNDANTALKNSSFVTAIELQSMLNIN
jgi:hypothetical protein